MATPLELHRAHGHAPGAAQSSWPRPCSCTELMATPQATKQRCILGLALQIQCYQCEEMTRNECSTPEFVVNCTVNVQDMCQKEVLVKGDGESGLLYTGIGLT
ncbi:unnamed protein product [Boreogadus saida]